MNQAPFVQSVVRDLVSVLAAPGLLEPLRPEILSDRECEAWLKLHEAELRALDRDPAPLLAWLEARLTSPLLGRYFEALVGYWIQHLFLARRFESSIVVSRERRTLGELDFIFEDPRGLLWHWEVAVKFYLCKAATPVEAGRTDAFWGAMTQDRLDKKLTVIFDRQLGMPHSAEGREALASAGFSQSPNSKLLMKGMLFYPAAHGVGSLSDWRNTPHPPEVSNCHARGWWATELPEAEAWTVLKRKQWLSPFRGPVDFEPISPQAMRHYVSGHFAEDLSPLMLAEVARAPDGSWSEIHRGLLMRPGWPRMD